MDVTTVVVPGRKEVYTKVRVTVKILPKTDVEIVEVTVAGSEMVDVIVIVGFTVVNCGDVEGTTIDVEKVKVSVVKR